MTPSPRLHQDMKLETLSLAKKVPALAPGKERTKDSLSSEAAMAAPDLLNLPTWLCLLVTYCSAYSRTLLACCNTRTLHQHIRK